MRGSAQPLPVLLSVGDVARRSGIAVSALHFYESRGLIRSLRSSGNQRRFARDSLRRIAFIRAAQSLGIPLAEIAEALAALPDARTPNRADWEQLSSLWRARLDDRIRHLVQLRDALDQCIGCGCLSLTDCQLYNAGDRLAAQGPGPQRGVTVLPSGPKP